MLSLAYMGRGCHLESSAAAAAAAAAHEEEEEEEEGRQVPAKPHLLLPRVSEVCKLFMLCHAGDRACCVLEFSEAF